MKKLRYSTRKNDAKKNGKNRGEGGKKKKEKRTVGWFRPTILK